MSLFPWLRGAEKPDERVLEGPPGPLARRRYRFSGRVQGVGFRYEACMTAEQLGLTGWARNESDGTVTVEIEGGTRRIGEFLRLMQEVPRFRIRDIETEELPPSGTETAFKTLY